MSFLKWLGRRPEQMTQVHSVIAASLAKPALTIRNRS